MSGRKSRDKGARMEREIASLLPGAEKISGMYRPGADVAWRGLEIEVKARADGFKFDYRHLRDVQILAKRADRQPWLLVMTVDVLLDLINGDDPLVSYCFEHMSADIRVRDRGRYTCDRWHPDDPCDIDEGRVVRVTPTVQDQPTTSERR